MEEESRSWAAGSHFGLGSAKKFRWVITTMDLPVASLVRTKEEWYVELKDPSMKEVEEIELKP